MFEITCPNCGKTRTAKIFNKKWGPPPYLYICKSCCQLGKTDSKETIDKKSEALKGKKKPPEYSQRLIQRHKDDPSLRKNLMPGAGAAWNKDQKKEKTSDEL